MDTMSAQRLDAALDTSVPLQLVRAAAALRWKRPDLTVTLAELALDAADDAATWVAAAGWLLHGRNLLGDGRQIACDLLDGLGRWGDAGAELMTGPQGRRLRIELAGPARRTGEQAVAQALLAADPGVDACDGELRADVLAELARGAVDEVPDTADAALDAAEQAWLAVGCAPGVASVLLIRATRDRRAGRADASVAAAVAGLAGVNASGRRAGGTESDHLAAALTAEWIAALVDAGRMDEVRSDAVPAANRLLTATRPSRQLAGLRLAVARVAAVSESADTVLAALEPAAQDAADGDVPELESACRSMLGELHEAVGRLDAALTAVRAAMAAERCDHDRGARLRTRLATVAATWAGRPSGHGVVRYAASNSLPDAALQPAGDGSDVGWADHPAAAEAAGRDTGAGEPGRAGPLSDPDHEPAPDPLSTPVDRTARARARAGNWSGATGAGRRARRLATEGAVDRGWSTPPLPELGTPASERSHPDPDSPGSAIEVQPAAEADKSWFDHATTTLHAAGATGATGHGVSARSRGEGPSVARPVAADGPPTTGTPAGSARTTDTGRAVAIGAASGSTSLIGDALLRELIEHARPGVRHDASTGEPRSPGQDSGAARTVESHTDRWDGGPGDTGHGNGSSSNGVSGLDRRRDDPVAPPVRRTDADVADTVVFELDRRHDSTVAVPPVHLTRDMSHDDAAGRHRPAGRGPDPGSGFPQNGAAAGPASVAGPLPCRGPGGPEAPVRDSASIGGGPNAPAPGAADPRPDGARRPSTTDTDGLGIGDLLAGALAAYRGI